jgi:REP element-mobilizing transposase RayT
MPTHPNRHPRSFPTRRLPSHDYTANGAYFVTICAYQRQPYFAHPALAAILQAQWQDLPHRFEGISLDRFVIMPDHLHFIIWIKRQGEPRTNLPEIIRVYKSITVVAWLQYLRETNTRAEGRIWQRGYYDRIIRDKQELDNTRRYIENNPRCLNTHGNV